MSDSKPDPLTGPVRITLQAMPHPVPAWARYKRLLKDLRRILGIKVLRIECAEPGNADGKSSV